MRGLRYKSKLNTYVENEGCNERTNSINKFNKKQERREKTSLAMMLMTHPDRQGQVSAIDVTFTSERNAFSALKRDTLQIVINMMMKSASQAIEGFT